MKTYVQIYLGYVSEVIHPRVDDDGNEVQIHERYTPQFISTLVDVSLAPTQPQVGWSYDGKNFSPPAA